MQKIMLLLWKNKLKLSITDRISVRKKHMQNLSVRGRNVQLQDVAGILFFGIRMPQLRVKVMDQRTNSIRK